MELDKARNPATALGAGFGELKPYGGAAAGDPHMQPQWEHQLGQHCNPAACCALTWATCACVAAACAAAACAEATSAALAAAALAAAACVEAVYACCAHSAAAAAGGGGNGITGGIFTLLSKDVGHGTGCEKSRSEPAAAAVLM
eukprot:CAMPEP_0168452218 /NCGR_PEP_ID=MMETSP0228-20121227/49038_1 /TAXON_ID=133427 /ORGANISM="Protoceratium reticulatum, Strain CCCM 535 (=CCMP 1889)" /LENGTH=143 /DNA_ID=CAMNT_0008466859 /DNA_START=153 /DNA_END=585 /DNA_ORIENTATION=+